MEQLIKQLIEQMNRIEKKMDVGFQSVEKKLDAIITQTAKNTEQVSNDDILSVIVKQHENRIKALEDKFNN